MARTFRLQGHAIALLILLILLLLFVFILKSNAFLAKQDVLSFPKTWLVPVVELGVLTFVILKSSEYIKEEGTKTLSMLGVLENSNMVMCLNEPQQLEFLYRKPKTFTTLFLFVDDYQNLISPIERHLSK